MTKRRTHPVLALVAAFAVLIGACSGDDNDSEDPNAGQSPVTAPGGTDESTSTTDESGNDGDSTTSTTEQQTPTSDTLPPPDHDQDHDEVVEDDIVDASLYRFPDDMDLSKVVNFFEPKRDGLKYPDYWVFLWRFTADGTRNRDALYQYMASKSDLRPARAQTVYDRGVDYLKSQHSNIVIHGGGAATPVQEIAHGQPGYEDYDRKVVMTVVGYELHDGDDSTYDGGIQLAGVLQYADTLEPITFFPLTGV